VASCGGSSDPAPKTGCRGLRTARHPQQFLVLFGAIDRLTQAQVCAQFGAPQKVVLGRGRDVSWVYGSSTIKFRGQRIVGWTGYERGSPSSTYSISQSVQAQK
jgi:hypothetical protein